jgi:hypothetical protein
MIRRTCQSSGPANIGPVVKLKAAKPLGLTRRLPLLFRADEGSFICISPNHLINRPTGRFMTCSGRPSRQPTGAKNDIRDERAAGEGGTIARVAHRIAWRTLS